MASTSSMKAVVGRGLREAGAALKTASGMEIFTRHRPVVPFNKVKPFKTNDTFIAPTASVIGNVTNWDESSVWYGAVVRAEYNPITIGFSSSIGDRTVITSGAKNSNTLQSGFPESCTVGHYVTVGAGSVLQSCTVEDLVEIGENSTILEGAVVESNVILEPGTVVPPYARIPSGEVWGGNPASFIRKMEDEDKDHVKAEAEKIAVVAQEHILEFLPIGNTYVHLEELERKGIKTQSG